MCGFHDYFIDYFYNNVYNKNLKCDSETLLYIKDLAIEKNQDYSFEYMNKEDFMQDIDNDTFLNVCFDAMKYENLNLLSLKNTYGDKLDMDFSMIEKEASQCIDYLENLFYNADTPEEMENKYNEYINSKLSGLKTKMEYISLKFYTDMYLSSFTTWCNILYGGGEKMFTLKKKDKKGWLSSAWSSVKQAAKETWKEVKPVVAADAKGAVKGAIVGACAGGVGAGPGAAYGAAGSSAGKCVEQIIMSK